MSIEPDNKDWTWVLDQPCPDCAYDASRVVPRDVGLTIREIASQWDAVLVHPQCVIRPRPNIWSALEYGCHVRDVFRLFDKRLVMMLTLDTPTFANWDQDKTAVDDRYDLQDPVVVRREIVFAGDQLADRFDSVADAEWHRKGLRSDGAVFSIDTFGRYLLHDPIHHLWDVAH